MNLKSAGFFDGAVPSTDANFGDDEDWTAAIAPTNNGIGQFLRDAGASGTVKSLWTVLRQTQETIDWINSTHADENGEPKDCTAIDAKTNVNTPFWSTATGVVADIDDTGKYKCYVENDGMISAFGRHAITSPADSCTDPYEYYVVTASAQEDQPTQGADIDNYGATSDGGNVSRFHYHGCDRSITVQLATFTQYSGGTEFSLRTEIEGNVGTSAFKMRSAWVDILAAGGGGVSTLVANGTTFKVGSSNGKFLIGELYGDCPTATTCAAPTGKFNFCVKNTGATTSTMGLADDTATCTDNATIADTYTDLTPIVDSGDAAGIPRELFTVTKAEMGL
jgi:hypothetical protein